MSEDLEKSMQPVYDYDLENKRLGWTICRGDPYIFGNF